MAREKREFDVMERLGKMVEEYEERTGRDFWTDLRDEMLMSDMPSRYLEFFERLLDGEGGPYA